MNWSEWSDAWNARVVVKFNGRRIGYWVTNPKTGLVHYLSLTCFYDGSIKGND